MTPVRKRFEKGADAETAIGRIPFSRPRDRRVFVAGLTLAVLVSGCREDRPRASRDGATRPPSFVGGEICAGCHPAEAERWRGSHHDLAMDEATEKTVLGDFENATFTYAGTTSTFFRRGGAYFVRTDGPDGELDDYRIDYTFGTRPLQQYLVAFPGGRFQALSIAWDARPAADGGQRWYHLYPNEAVDHADPLHWTHIYQNWNQQCAECHSTHVRKGLDPESGTYATTWSDIDVSCEACHGPGSAHAAQATAIVAGEATGDPAGGLIVTLEGNGAGAWKIHPETGIAERTGSPGSPTVIETCGRCHARRSPLADSEPGRPLLDTHRLALLEEDLYHADGQIRDEVYVYGSFLQSKMHAAGVVCTDCHDPHGLEIPSPDAVCGRCHLGEKFGAPEHHRHEADSAGASCVGCHMPARDFMVIDSRRDHSFKVPRPDLSREIGTPNACSDCHADRTVEWAADTFWRWYGDVDAGRPGFARALDAARRGLPEARRLLATLATDPKIPGIVRATALALPRHVSTLGDPRALRDGLVDPDPLVRFGAVQGVEATDPGLWLELLAPLLEDPLRAVRIEAGRVLSRLPREAIPEEHLAAFERASSEYQSAQIWSADRPESQLDLGLVYEAKGLIADADRAYRRALEIDPWFSPAYVNLADLYRATGRDARGEQVLRRGLETLPEDPAIRHSLGLVLVRRGRYDEALEELSRAAERAPRQPRYAYVYGVALHSRGETDLALDVLAEAHRRNPSDTELLTGLATLHRDAGKAATACEYAGKLLALRPEDPAVRQLVAELREGR